MAMVKCPACSEDNPAKFRLCGHCGTPLVGELLPQAHPHEVRKTVTVVFCDLKDSTALGERLDAEVLHDVKARYFKGMAAEIVRHGGRVEKYIGDAVMAVFGLPRAHEDDALRALRACLGMQAALASVNESLAARHGLTLAIRIGVNTGSVVANIVPDADQQLATGDAVNVAARLEQAAPENQIYLGEATHRLVRDAVSVERVEPLEMKGKGERVAAYRLLAASGIEGLARRVDTPLVGRDDEVALLQGAFDETLERRTAQMVTVIGDAGAGKSRLLVEFIERIGRGVNVVRGRCLPYGDGITFLPLVTMLREAAAVVADDPPEVARAKVLGLVGEREVTDRLAAAIGLSAAIYPVLELHWAARRFLEVLAADAPVVAVVDDIHWAEPALLEWLEHVLDASSDAPILLLATSRHDLLEERPQWGERAGAKRLVLMPLSDDASSQVVANLSGSAGLPQEVVDQLVRAAEGNPLYVEQMFSMVMDGGLARPGGTVADLVPPSIHALLEARLDSLPASERTAVEPASVIGLEFALPAVQALSPEPCRASVDVHLQSLTRKKLIQRVTASHADPVYRFHHHLIRETVYNGLLKRARATLHHDFVRWADQVNGESGRALEFEEILGYHLEQSYRYLSELGALDAAGLAIGADAARRLGDSGRRAFARADMHAAVNLFERAARLLPPLDPKRLALLPDLAEASMEVGDLAAARAIVDEGLEAADAANDERLRHSMRVRRMFVRMFGGEPGEWGAQALQVAAEAVAALTPMQAHNELANAWRLIAFVHGVAGRYAESGAATRPYIDHARAAGNLRLVARACLGLANGILPGATPVREGIAQCEALLTDVRDRQVVGIIQCIVAQLRAMNGEFEQARALYHSGRATLRDLGRGLIAAQTGVDVARVELLAGDLTAAERELRVDCDFLVKAGETYMLSTLAAVFARVQREQGHDDEALALSKTAEGAAAVDDVDAQVQWRSVRAPILARRGAFAEAEGIARAAVALAASAEVPLLLAEAHTDLAQVLVAAGRRADARAEYSRAADVSAAKGDAVSAERSRAAAAAL